jgi:hypothetical protein
MQQKTGRKRAQNGSTERQEREHTPVSERQANFKMSKKDFGL